MTSSTVGSQLASQIRAALTEIPVSRTHPILEAWLPLPARSTQAIRELLTKRALTIIGSRGPRRSASTPDSDTPAIYLAAERAAWLAAAAWFDQYQTPRPLLGFAPAYPTVRTAPMEFPGVWEAVLHPDPVACAGVGPVAISDATFEEFVAAVEAVGGKVAEDRLRPGSLSWVPIELPEGAEQHLARHNQLRELHPMPAISVR